MQPKTEEIGIEPAKPNFRRDNSGDHRVIIPRDKIKMTQQQQ